MGRSAVRSELSNEGTLHTPFFNMFMFIIRFLAPVAIALVFMNGVGLLNF
jgi:NSS family neurotransmitter:Na+ symporter